MAFARECLAVVVVLKVQKAKSMTIRDNPVAVELDQDHDAYSARLDLARGIDACYAAIRERVRNGGKPWTPPEGGVAVSHETGETTWAGPSCNANPTLKPECAPSSPGKATKPTAR
jgi:hypothetical protein